MTSGEFAAGKVKEFFSSYRPIVYEKGQLLVLADENPKNIIYLESGIVREYDISYKGDEVVVNVFKTGAFFPMSWAIAKTPNRYFFEAASKLKTRQAPAGDVLSFMKQNPMVMLDLLTRLYIGVDGLQRRMAHLMGGSASSRLLFELYVECQRFGKKTPSGSILIKINESELGARAGLARETVSREIKDLKKVGLIKLVRHGIIVKNIDILKTKLGSDL